MTIFLEDHGWVIDVMERPAMPGTACRARPGAATPEQQCRAVALRMTFEGCLRVAEIRGEGRLSGHYNYFLGSDERRWRTAVPRYGSVRYRNLYPGIDVTLQEANGLPEYDLLLEPGADLSLVTVRVEGAKRLSIAMDGSLVIETALGPLTQPLPRTWQVDGEGRKQDVACNFTLVGSDRFGFLVAGWDGGTSLVIDPGLIWSTYLGGANEPGSYDAVSALSVDAQGIVTVAGYTQSMAFPTTTGAYDRKLNGVCDVLVSRLDPRKTGSAQLIYSTFLGGGGCELANALAVEASGVVTVAGNTYSSSANDFPTTNGAYDSTYNGPTGCCLSYGDAFISRLDPRKTGSAQLVYSTFLGGSNYENARALAVDGSGVVTVAGWTSSTNFPTTANGYDSSFNSTPQNPDDIFISRLDPSKIGAAQLVYSTYLGGIGSEGVDAMTVDDNGLIAVTGYTGSVDFPTTSGAYDTTHNGNSDVIVSVLDSRRTGTAQLIYSTYLGGSGADSAYSLSRDGGFVVLTGTTQSSDFPTTSGAYDRTFNTASDAFVCRLLPAPLGKQGLFYSTFLGGQGHDSGQAISADAKGVLTVAGQTAYIGFPTTSNAYDRTPDANFYDEGFVSRLDPSRTGNAQLVYSTYLGGNRPNGPGPGHDSIRALAVDPSGVVTVAGYTWSDNFPTTTGAYSTTHGGYGLDAFVSRLDMGVAFYGDVHEISITAGGTQWLTVNPGKPHGNRSYWVFGSVSGTTPGVNLGSAIGSVHVPLNPDLWTDYTIALANTALLSNTKATLDASGTAQASFHVPKANLPSAIGLVFHHAYLVYDANNNFYMASNPVPLGLVR